MTIHMFTLLTSFLLCSYSIGWIINGLRARHNGYLDICSFIQSFIFSPFVCAVLCIIAWIIIYGIIPALIANFFGVLKFIGIIVVSLCIFIFGGKYVVAPAVGKAYGVVKPFSEKICVVIYRKK